MNIKKSIPVALALAVIFFIAPRIDTYNELFSLTHYSGQSSSFLRILGEAQSIISNYSILQADMYYHGGVGHFYDEHASGMGIIDHFEDRSTVDINHKEKEEESFHRKESHNPLLNISNQIGLTEHVHLGNDELKEIIPWLYYSAKLDPHNVLAFTLTGYFLSERLDKIDEALSFLKEGLKYNPDSWEIYAEIGYVYFKQLKEYDVAMRYLTRSWMLLKKVPHDKFQERFVLTLIANGYELLGQSENAYPIYVHLNELFPNDIFEKKIEKFTTSNKV